jgi:hypothetical protein
MTEAPYAYDHELHIASFGPPYNNILLQAAVARGKT